MTFGCSPATGWFAQCARAYGLRPYVCGHDAHCTTGLLWGPQREYQVLTHSMRSSSPLCDKELLLPSSWTPAARHCLGSPSQCPTPWHRGQNRQSGTPGRSCPGLLVGTLGSVCNNTSMLLYSATVTHRSCMPASDSIPAVPLCSGAHRQLHPHTCGALRRTQRQDIVPAATPLRQLHAHRDHARPATPLTSPLTGCSLRRPAELHMCEVGRQTGSEHQAPLKLHRNREASSSGDRELLPGRRPATAASLQAARSAAAVGRLSHVHCASAGFRVHRQVLSPLRGRYRGAATALAASAGSLYAHPAPAVSS